jgi:hypothetical protein
MRVWESVIIVGLVAGCASSQPAQPTPDPVVVAAPAKVTWKRNDRARPQPPIARPVAAVLIPPPADATVLFDGRSLAAWADTSGKPASWKVENGYFEIVPGTGDIRTRATFGDAQLHVEFATPAVANPGSDQGLGNSGVYLMEQYEVQVLDSFGNITYADGAAGAVYGQYPPLYNASLPPGEWQSYDIVFRAPRFEGGRVVRPARITVIHNGVVVQDAVEILGQTVPDVPRYVPHADRMPILLQDHGDRVRYRNIWVRELGTGE